jgi:hypothetical protein
MGKKFSLPVQKSIINVNYSFVIFVATKKGWTTNLSPSSSVVV